MTETVAAQSLLTPDNCAMIFIDRQGQTVFGVQSINRRNSSTMSSDSPRRRDFSMSRPS